MDWARRLKRVFGIEVDICQRCGGRLEIIVSIEQPEVIARILAHLERAAPKQYQCMRSLGARTAGIRIGYAIGPVCRYPRPGQVV